MPVTNEELTPLVDIVYLILIRLLFTLYLLSHFEKYVRNSLPGLTGAYKNYDGKLLYIENTYQDHVKSS